MHDIDIILVPLPEPGHGGTTFAVGGDGIGLPDVKSCLPAVPPLPVIEW